MFDTFSLSPELLQVVRELGYETPTPIQQKAIPLLLQGKDLIAQSQTGSGKTAAFALPVLQKLSSPQSRRELQALVLCPTRELCAQVAREIRKLGRRHPGLQVLVLSGGMPMGPQLGALEKGVHIVAGTPGRVLDHVRRKSLDLSSVRTLVLDEADRMLEMGFEEDMEKILAQVPKDRQTVLLSATFPKTIEELSRKYQRSPVRVTATQENQTVATIRQVVYEVEQEDRLKALLWVIEQNKVESAIVFCNLKAVVIGLARDLEKTGLSAGALHGDLEQNDRDRVMAKFRNRSLRILIATDVAARGIDVENLDLVVNYDLPSQPEVYVHRIGRTGRAGQRGLAVSFHGSGEKGKLRRIEEFASVELQRKTIASLEKLDPARMGGRLQATSAVGNAEMRTLFIGAGRKEKIRPGDILGALTGEAGGHSGADIGKIEIHDHFSYVAVSAKIADLALQRLRNGRIKGRKVRVEAVK